MWFAWSVISLGQLYTNRYAKHWWQYRHAVHNVLGMLMGGLTVAGIVIVLKWLGWAFYFDHYHNVAGMIFMVLCMMLVLGGIFNQINRSFINNDWNTKRLLRASSGHKYFGYFIIFAV